MPKTKKRSPKTVKILVIDGGGIRGCIPLKILEDLEARIHKIERERYQLEKLTELSHLAQKFDVVSGTSTGGIIALGLNVPCSEDDPDTPKYRPRDLLDIYTKHGKKIFKKSIFRNLYSCWGLSKPKYSAAGFKALAKRYFEDCLISQSVTNTLVTGFEIERFVPIFFKSASAQKEAKQNFKMREVALATSSAPTYFKPAKIKNTRNTNYYVVDGGVIVNNPAMSALVEARRLYPDANDYLVVSIGTGNTQKSISYTKIKNKGGIGWLNYLLKIFMKGVSAVVDYQLHDLLSPEKTDTNAIKPRYYRLQPIIPADISDMDDPSSETINKLIYIAEHCIKENADMLDLIAEELCEGVKACQKVRRRTMHEQDQKETFANLLIEHSKQECDETKPVDETAVFSAQKEDPYIKYHADRYFGELN